MDLWLRLVLAVWLAVISLVDLRTRCIPNALVLPPLAVALLWRLGRGEWAVLLLCTGLYLAWSAGLLGGAGDAKLLMALAVLFPRLEYALVLALVVLAVALPWSLIRCRGRFGGLLRRLRPSDEQLEREGVPFAWVFSLGTLVYAWITSL